MRGLGGLLPLGALAVASLCLGLLVSRIGVTTIALEDAQQFFGAAEQSDSPSAWSDVAVHDLRTMVESKAISFEAFKAEMVRRMRLASSLPALAALNRQLGSVLQELEQQRAAAPPDSQLDVQPGVGAAFRNARGSDGGVRSGGDGMGAGASGASGAGGSGGAAAVDAGGDDGTGSERPPVSVGDGLPILPAPGTEAGNAPPISDALISAIQRARLHPQSEPVNVTRLIPTLIFIGNPKCGSTFLWDCVRSGIFDPSNICGKDSAGWRTCNRRYLITAFGPRKEFNFYDKHFYKGHGWEWYVGPEIPISSWERTGRPWTLNAPRVKDVANRQGYFSQVIDKEVKPVCRKITEHWRCEYSEACVPLGSLSQHANVKRVLLDHALPRRIDVSPFAMSADPSINYFIKAGPMAMRWMYEGAIDPAALRFILLMRDPLERTYSNWLMFRQWNWEDEPNFTRAAEVELDALRACDPAAFADPAARLPAMSQSELDLYHANCILGGRKHLLNHVRGSMYVVGALQWFRWFAPSQFLVLDNDEVRSLRAEELLGRIAEHTGLHLERSKVGNFRPECEGLQHSGDPRKHYHKHKYEAKARGLLRGFFRPYNAMLYERLSQLKVRWPDE